jgi:DNA-binding Lrp family transcriptional regulator
LENDGVVRKYTAVLDNSKAGRPVEAFIRVDVGRDPDKLIEKFIDRPEVEECYVVTGSIEVMFKVAVPDMAALNKLVSELNTKNVLKVSMQMILKKAEKRQKVKTGRCMECHKSGRHKTDEL